MKTLAKKHRAFPTISLEGGDINRPQPIYVIPATPEAYEAQVEAMARGMFEVFHGQKKPVWEDEEHKYRERWRDFAKAALTSLGIRRPTAARKGKQ